MKQLIQSMGANKSKKAISRARKASGGVRKIVESFNEEVDIHRSEGLEAISVGPFDSFNDWIARHKKNMLVHHTVLQDDEDSDEEGSDED